MYHIFCADHGEVRISEAEMQKLQLAEDIDRFGVSDHPLAPKVRAVAEAIKAACHRFAEYQSRAV